MSDTSDAKTSKSDTEAKEPVKSGTDAKDEVQEEAKTAPEPTPEPAPLPKEPRKGVYTLMQGDTPGIVSIKFYGRSHKANELVKANPGNNWQPGDVIVLV